jgi:predicted MFS family arabinose efflux permease
MAAVTGKRSAFSRGQTTTVIVAGALILSVAMGIRQTFGLFVDPLSVDRGISLSVIALAIALHNLVWGFAQPFAGAAADRYGAAPVVAFGALTLAAGLALAAVASSGWLLVIGMGLLVGIGVSCTTFAVVLASVGRVASPERRSMAMGIASAGGSFGQFILVPATQFANEGVGISVALIGLAVLMAIVSPLGIALDRRDVGSPAQLQLTYSLNDVLSLAFRHRGYILLTLGFFTCGFQLAFIATYLPGYLVVCNMPAGLGAAALATIGLFNMAGTWACGWLGGKVRQQYVLGWLYLIRGAAIAVFFLLPKTDTSVMIFAAVMGLTWLGTVPLTSGLVAKIFGTQHLGTLFGVCFLSHQVGSFLGAGIGGVIFDLTGSYSPLWIATAVAGLVAALLHFPINDTSVEAARAPASA